jgi:hypothetical protein
MGRRMLDAKVPRGLGSAGTAALGLAILVGACATAGSGDLDFAKGTGGNTSHASDASAGSSGSSAGDDSGTGMGTGDDGGSAGDDVSTGDDVSASDDATAGDDSAAGDDAAGGDDSAAPAPPTYVCTTTLPAPSPVCDSKHQYCLCTDDSQCNSSGMDVVNKGGCNSRHCSGSGKCTGGQFTDSAGCSVVAPTCNLGGNQGCPAKTACEVNHGGCGGSAQCCWCTSDAACPVGGKCVDDPTQKQCTGMGPCTGSGSDYDGMHCQLASPGIPMCTMQ